MVPACGHMLFKACIENKKKISSTEPVNKYYTLWQKNIPGPWTCLPKSLYASWPREGRKNITTDSFQRKGYT